MTLRLSRRGAIASSVPAGDGTLQLGDSASITDSAVPTTGGGEDPGGTLPSGTTEQFLDSVGINTHTYYTSTPDNAYEAHTAVRWALNRLGVRHIREHYTNNSTQRTRLAALKTDYGIGFSAILDTRFYGYASYAAALDQIISTNLASCSSIEGPNEWDIGPGSSGILGAQQGIWNAWTARSQLSGIPVISASVAHSANWADVGDLTNYCHHGNMHSYPGGFPPDGQGQGAGSDLPGWMTNTDAKTPTPLWSTETGYHTYPQTSGHLGTSEAAQAVYVPQMYFEYWRQGVERTFLYELVDEHEAASQEDRFGLFHWGAIGSTTFGEKAAATNLARMIGWLEGGAASPTLQRLGFSFTGAPTTLRTVLLQSDTLQWVLAIYNDVSVWDPTTGTTLTPANDDVTLNLTSYRNLVVRDVSTDTVVSTDTGINTKAITVPPARPLILEISS